MRLLPLLISFVYSLDCWYESQWGSECNNNSSCNGDSSDLNYCDFDTNRCHCDIYRYMGGSCEYERYNKDMAGGLQFFSLIGIGGVGNFVIGNEAAVGQAILSGFLFLLIPLILLWYYCCPENHTNEEQCCCGMMCGFSFIFLVLYLGGVIWSIVDAASIFRGDVSDSEGYYPINSPCIDNYTYS